MEMLEGVTLVLILASRRLRVCEVVQRSPHSSRYIKAACYADQADGIQAVTVLQYLCFQGGGRQCRGKTVGLYRVGHCVHSRLGPAQPRQDGRGFIRRQG